MSLSAPPRQTRNAPRARRSSAPSKAEPRNRILWVALEWIREHCVIPDGFREGEPFDPYEWQQQYLGHFYLVRGDAEWDSKRPQLAKAFVYRRALLVGPQKLGKDPLEAAQICLEGAGPCVFAGWAVKGEAYRCRDHGCPCGWEYDYDAGEPKGMPWPTPLIQITAVSQEATQNTYDALRPMIEKGKLANIIPRTGEEFIRLPRGGRIDTVTSSALSRLGQRVTFVSQGEVGIYTRTNGMEKVADTQYRGLAGMGGRASLHTNAWDPSEHSVAQQQYESNAPDVYRQFDSPPNTLSFRNKEERRKILRRVYPSDTWRENGGHVDLDAIEAEAADLVSRDPAQAARFFGNQLVAGAGKAFDLEQWNALADPKHVVPKGALIALGFDGSRVDDHTALIATEIATGFQWPLGVWDPATFAGEIPAHQVNAAVDDAFHDYKVIAFYYDPPYWKDEGAAWEGRYGDKIVHAWPTYRNRPMGFAVRNFVTAIGTGALSHSGDATLTRHIGNAHRRELLERDDKGARLWTLQKERDGSPDKIDGATAACLSWEARSDAISDGALNRKAHFKAFLA